MPKYRNQKDLNQDKIVKRFEKHGAKVLDLHNFGDGKPDLLVKHKHLLFFVEVKNGIHRHLRKGQQEFFLEFFPLCLVVREEIEVDIIMNKIKKSGIGDFAELFSDLQGAIEW